MMTKAQTCLNIKCGTAFLYATDIKAVLTSRDMIAEGIKSEEIKALAIILEENYTSSDIDSLQKDDLYKWLDLLPIPKIGIGNCHFSSSMLELFMLCDIRLGGSMLSLEFPKDGHGFTFDFLERCQLLLGKKESIQEYSRLFGASLSCDEAYKMRLINEIINTEAIEGEVQKYINKLLENKGSYQIQAIMECFNSYKQLGLNIDQEILLEQESKQFCNLIIKEYLKK